MPFGKHALSPEVQRFVLGVGAAAFAMRNDTELAEPPELMSVDVLEPLCSFERPSWLGRLGLSRRARNEARNALLVEWNIEYAWEAIEKARELLDGLHDKLYRDFLNHDPFAGKDYGVRSIIAWDLAQMVDLLRQCITAQYGDLSQIRDLLLNAARRAQSNFSSWHDFAASYLAGEAFWLLDLPDDEEEDEDDGPAICDDICRWLLSHPQSLWVTTPWRTAI